MRRQHVDPNRQINFLAKVASKVCSKCGIEKNASEFGGRAVTLDGMTSWCHACGADYQRRYYATDIEECRRRKREWMAKARLDPQKRKEINGRARASYFLRKDKNNVANRAAWARKFFWARASRLGSVKLAASLAGMWKRQRGLCALTGERLIRENAHLDHILPRARGGTNELSNLRWVTDRVNTSKRDMTDEEFFALCASVTARRAHSA